MTLPTAKSPTAKEKAASRERDRLRKRSMRAADAVTANYLRSFRAR